ncbi:hypothetical protein ACFY3G_22050 [Streptomyces phaeochromogenes]|uniref:hypothetical protein n=1 Tax=Streptomyces phaeochromogenes TaxID=1923 RepID=UPI003678365A
MRTIRTRLRFGVPDLPDDPTTEQVDAWVELAELLQPAGEARERGLAPDAPEAATVLAEVLGDADRAAVLDHMVSASRAEVARFRELPALVRGTEPLSTHRQAFAWVVAALRAQLGS